MKRHAEGVLAEEFRFVRNQERIDHEQHGTLERAAHPGRRPARDRRAFVNTSSRHEKIGLTDNTPFGTSTNTSSRRVTSSLVIVVSCASRRSEVNASLFNLPPPWAPRPSANSARGSPKAAITSRSSASSVSGAPAGAMRAPLERAGDLADAVGRILLRLAPNRIVINHGPKHEGVIGVDPEGELTSRLPGLDGVGTGVGQRLHVTIEAAALTLQRAVIDEAVAYVDVENLVERPMECIDRDWLGLVGTCLRHGFREAGSSRPSAIRNQGRQHYFHCLQLREKCGERVVKGIGLLEVRRDVRRAESAAAWRQEWHRRSRVIRRLGSARLRLR